MLYVVFKQVVALIELTDSSRFAKLNFFRDILRTHLFIITNVPATLSAA